jgi:AraC family transcriptional regulator
MIRVASMKSDSVTDAHRPDTVEANQASVERAILHMKQHIDEPLDLDGIARIAAVSKFHFVRVFDQVTGITPHYFLACLRMQRAKEILLNSDTSITDVCMAVGYASLGTFSRTFNELVGVSPQEFRALPRRISAKQFASAIWRYLAARPKISGPALEGTVEGSRVPRGFTFVGTFIRGVPQGVPYSGTVLVAGGTFKIERPTISEYHLMAALVPFSASLTEMAVNLPISMVASQRVQNGMTGGSNKPHLRLRPLRTTDPPIVLALQALPPLMAFTT